MRKVLSILLFLVLIFSFSACTKTPEQEENSGVSGGEDIGSSVSTDVFAAPRSLATTGGVGEKRSLANTYKCLTVDKELDVLYIGGSLTYGTGSSTTECWRAYTTKWLKETYPNAKINETNTAIGGTGSLWGLARTKREVIDKNPDLVFIEFAMNDTYFNLTKEQAAAYMEGMVRQINTALPNTDIIIILTTDDARLGKRYPTLEGHIAVAEFYGIPYINVGEALIEPVKNGGWNQYAADNVHLNAEGYRIYADEVIKNLQSLLSEAADKTAAPCVLPEGYLLSNNAAGVTMMEADELEKLNTEQWRFLADKGVYTKNKGCVMPRSNDAVLKVEFDGSVLCLYGDKSTVSEVIIKIDGVEVTKISEGYEKYREIMGADNLKPGHHTAEIMVSKRGLKIDALIVG